LVVPASADFDSPDDLARPSRAIDQSGSVASCACASTNPDQLSHGARILDEIKEICATGS